MFCPIDSPKTPHYQPRGGRFGVPTLLRRCVATGWSNTAQQYGGLEIRHLMLLLSFDIQHCRRSTVPTVEGDVARMQATPGLVSI